MLNSLKKVKDCAGAIVIVIFFDQPRQLTAIEN